MYIIIFLLCMNVLGLILNYRLDIVSLKSIISLFDFNTEMNLPTLFSGIILFFSSFLLYIIALNHKTERNPYISWVGLSCVFLFIAIDELGTIHESIMWPIANLLNTSGILLFAWIIPYGLLVLFLGIIYLKFLINLPKTTLILFLVSAFLYISGALGLELLQGKYYEQNGLNSIYYAFLYTCEETLEMIGVSIFIYSLLSYISNEFENLALTIKIND